MYELKKTFLQRIGKAMKSVEGHKLGEENLSGKMKKIVHTQVCDGSSENTLH